MRELAITRTGILCQAPYEVVAHKRIGKGSASPTSRTMALTSWKDAKCFDEVQRARARLHRRDRDHAQADGRDLNAIAAKLSPAVPDRAAALGRLLHHDVVNSW